MIETGSKAKKPEPEGKMASTFRNRENFSTPFATHCLQSVILNEQ